MIWPDYRKQVGRPNRMSEEIDPPIQSTQPVGSAFLIAFNPLFLCRDSGTLQRLEKIEFLDAVL